jgi:hypothetical protein
MSLLPLRKTGKTPPASTKAFARVHALSKFAMAAILRRMRRKLILAATTGLTITWSTGCLTQDRPLDDPPQVSREEWQAQVKASRERLETMRRERKSFAPRAPTPEEVAEEASRRILQDDSLLPGDVVSTNRGLFQFQGSRDGERRSEDFVRIR